MITPTLYYSILQNSVHLFGKERLFSLVWNKEKNGNKINYLRVGGKNSSGVVNQILLTFYFHCLKGGKIIASI